tara:strand:- start:437 stop:976 length:540 start_codon:yes stop_codon:yes gene_type:complete
MGYIGQTITDVFPTSISVDTATITTANISNQLTDANMSAGSILQVKQSVFAHASGMSTSNTSMTTTGHTIAITPSSSSSKILLSNTTSLYNSAGNNVKISITRNHSGISETDLGTATDQGFTQLHASGATTGCGGAIVFLDSPSTTNEITYTVKMRVSGGTGYYPVGGDAILVAMEVAQ